MVRSILRNIQNALVLGSVALCILGFQRLESLDEKHHKTSPPSSLWPYPPPYTEKFSEDGSIDSRDSQDSTIFKIGPNHHELLVLKRREIRIGLFRLVIPTPFKQTTPAVAAWNNKQQQNLRRPVTTAKKKEESVQKESKREQEAAIVVVVENCNEDTVDAAAVLEQSLPQSAGIRLYAILLKRDTAECVNKLFTGFEIVVPSNVFPNVTTSTWPSCVTKRDLSLLVAHTLEAGVAIYIPLPSIVIPVNESSDSVSLVNAESIKAVESNVENQDTLTEKDSQNDVSAKDDSSAVLMTQPQGKEAVTKLTHAIEEHCIEDKQTPWQFSVNDLAAWQPCNGEDKETSCRITNSLSVATFSDCAMPWIEEEENDTSTDGVECRTLRQQWRQAREAVRSERKKIVIQSA